MKDLHVKPGRRYIASLIAEGEHERQDFKFLISDGRKIARSISAFANAGGGRLLIGVKDNGVVAGVRNEEDVYVVEMAAQRYCDPPQQVEFAAYSYDTGITVIVASIARASERPVRAQEPDGRWRAYYRVADENIVAHPLMVRAWQADTPLTLSLDATAVRLLELADSRPDGLDILDIAVELAVSRRRAENLVVSLVATGVLTFIYKAPSFRIIRQC